MWAVSSIVNVLEVRQGACRCPRLCICSVHGTWPRANLQVQHVSLTSKLISTDGKVINRKRLSSGVGRWVLDRSLKVMREMESKALHIIANCHSKPLLWLRALGSGLKHEREGVHRVIGPLR